MTKVKSFEEIHSWQSARELTVDIYKLTEDWKDFSLRDQLRRASVSIMNNIAEGFERQSNKDFRHFLYIAKGSCAEVRSMLNLVQDLGMVRGSQIKELIERTVVISKLLSGFIKTL